MEAMGVPKMLREARKAVTAQDYEQAVLLYTALIAREEMADNFDIKVRHAYCIEKTGQINQAITLYKDIVKHYRDAGETDAAESVEETIEGLENRVKEELAAARAEAERIEAEKARKAQEEIERLRQEKEREEQLLLQKEREEKIRLQKEREEQLFLEKKRKEREAREKVHQEEQDRRELIKKKKAEAEKARSERFKSKKTKPATTMTNFLDTIQTEAFNVSPEDNSDEEEIAVIDLSDVEETGPDQSNKPWLG